VTDVKRGKNLFKAAVRRFSSL